MKYEIIEPNLIRKALISDDGKYRYYLKRIWDENKALCLFICLNPSIADKNIDDKTVYTCYKYAKKWGFGCLVIVNLFAFRDTKGEQLYKIKNPVGIENDKFIINYANKADRIILAWGNDGSYRNRNKEVLKMLQNQKLKLYCLKINASTNEPHHPLYLSDDIFPIPYNL